jgi:hypothetical protein
MAGVQAQGGNTAVQDVPSSDAGQNLKLFWLVFYMVFFSPSRQMSGWYQIRL